ncbi:NADP-dependent phosphogluconate dehydrogenase [Lachnospiraceae bacterium 62-26]
MNYEIGVYGLGVMGASIAQNILNHGFTAAVYSKAKEERHHFPAEKYPGKCKVCESEQELVQSLQSPRKIFLMITAGAPVDSVVEALLPLLEASDVIFDGGNSYYKDTDRRCRLCAGKGIHYVGTGVSGGQLGALYGASIMPGGSFEGYLAGEKILKAVAAQVGEKPCCAYIGQGGSGHYVKMVHNGIEYAILQLIGEAYMILRHGLSMSHEEVLQVFRGWQGTKLDSYLIDISVQVMEKYEEDGTPLIDRILDVAEQKGTGKWTILEAIERGVYVPGIYEAVMARNFSAKVEERREGARLIKAPGHDQESSGIREELGDALLLAIALSYSQGMELIRKASDDNGWQIDQKVLADIWRDGCIIRSCLLSDIKSALEEEKAGPLVLSEAYGEFREADRALRRIVTWADGAGMACTGFSAALHYYDYYRTQDMPVRFVQALRDCFGAHTYMRNDMPGHFHTEW